MTDIDTNDVADHYSYEIDFRVVVLDSTDGGAITICRDGRAAR